MKLMIETMPMGLADEWIHSQPGVRRQSGRLAGVCACAI
jgi:hypothetical protein